jgi:hypothetical protein
MHFNIHYIGSSLQEMSVDEIHTGTLNKEEAIKLAKEMIYAADELLCNADSSFVLQEIILDIT